MRGYLLAVARRASKALAGAVGSTITGIGVAMADGHLTQTEVVAALGIGLTVGGGLVYSAPKNRG